MICRGRFVVTVLGKIQKVKAGDVFKNQPIVSIGIRSTCIEIINKCKGSC